MKARWTCLLALLFGVTFLAGCRNEYPETLEYTFSPYPFKNTKDEKEIFTLNPPNTRSASELAADLKPYFGTPRYPLVWLPAEDAAILEELRFQPVEQQDGSWRDSDLEKGSRLYRKYCLHCHGLVGDGNGSTAGPIAAPFLSPRPRDFRQGWFKFRSTAKRDSSGNLNTSAITLPSRADIARTIRQGIPTANMPSFNLLPEAEIDRLVTYVIHLSIRGRVERQYAGDPDAELEPVIRAEAKKWRDESKLVYAPPPPPKPWEELRTNREHGRKMYLSTTAACLDCHGKDGRSSPVELPTNLTRKNDWGDKNAPRDLTLGAYRGGASPVDIFTRLKLGIAGSGMPAATDKISDEDLWYIVDYVMSLPQQK